METWIIWLIIAAVLGTVEILTDDAGFGLVGAAALVGGRGRLRRAEAAPSSSAPSSLASARASASPGRSRCATSGSRRCCAPGRRRLSGGRPYVLDEVGAHGGRVRIGGEEWSARPYDETLVDPGRAPPSTSCRSRARRLSCTPGVAMVKLRLSLSSA